MKLTNLTITKTHQGLLKREFSATSLCKAYLDRIKEKDKEIFSYLTVTEDLALSQAKKSDDLISKKLKVESILSIVSGLVTLFLYSHLSYIS